MCGTPVAIVSDPDGAGTNYYQPIEAATLDVERIDGVARIAAERRRQIEAEGWSGQHDKETHGSNSLAIAAAAYALPPVIRGTGTPSIWPWDRRWWKPGPTRLRELEKAGALIAAEIDLRLAREYRDGGAA